MLKTEILCKAKGDACCRFVMAPPDKIKKLINKYIEKLPKFSMKKLIYNIPQSFKLMIHDMDHIFFDDKV